VSVHKIVPGPHMDAHARKLFGDQAAILVAFRSDAAFVVFGDPGATATMKSFIESKPGKAGAMIDVRGSIARLAGMDKDKGPAAQKAAEEVFGRNPRGKDVVSFRVEGGGAITVKFSLKADILKFGSRINESK